MTKKSYNRRSYRGRITNKKIKKTKKTKKTKKKSYKKGGMYRGNIDTLAAAAATAAPLEGPAVPPAANYDGVDVECDVYGAAAAAMDSFVGLIPDKDVRKATLNLRPPAPTELERNSADATIAAAAATAAAR